MAKKRRSESEELPQGEEQQPSGEGQQEQQPQQESQQQSEDSDVKRPQLGGERKKEKPKFEQPGTNNQSREVHEEQKPE